MLNPLKSATWYPTWEDFLPGDESGNNNLIKLSLNDMATINNSTSGQSENWWFNRYNLHKHLKNMLHGNFHIIVLKEGQRLPHLKN